MCTELFLFSPFILHLLLCFLYAQNYAIIDVSVVTIIIKVDILVIDI